MFAPTTAVQRDGEFPRCEDPPMLYVPHAFMYDRRVDGCPRCRSRRSAALFQPSDVPAVPTFNCQTRLQVDGELNTLLMRLPNLLDSRVPDGEGEEENVIVSEWGQEHIKRGEVRICNEWFGWVDLAARTARRVLTLYRSRAPYEKSCYCLPFVAF